MPDGARPSETIRAAASKWSWSTTGALHQSTRSPTRSQSGWTSPSWQRRTPVRRRPAISAPAHAHGRYPVFTDDDCVPAPGWLRALDTRADAFPGPRSGPHSQRAPRITLYSSVSQMVIEVVYAHYNADPDHARFFASNNLAAPADRFRALEGSIPTSTAEDRDLCERLACPRGRLVYAADAVVRHAHALTLGGSGASTSRTVAAPAASIARGQLWPVVVQDRRRLLSRPRDLSVLLTGYVASRSFTCAAGVRTAGGQRGRIPHGDIPACFSSAARPVSALSPRGAALCPRTDRHAGAVLIAFIAGSKPQVDGARCEPRPPCSRARNRRPARSRGRSGLVKVTCGSRGGSGRVGPGAGPRRRSLEHEPVGRDEESEREEDSRHDAVHHGVQPEQPRLMTTGRFWLSVRRAASESSEQAPQEHRLDAAVDNGQVHGHRNVPAEGGQPASGEP